MNLPEKPPSTHWHTAHGHEFGMWKSPDKIGRAFQTDVLYELPMLEWIYENCREFGNDQVAIDAGANIGTHTLWMAAVCGLYVHAFEPVMPHVTQANVWLNPGVRDRVTVHPFGLGQSMGEFHHVGKGVLRPGVSKQSTDEKCHVVTLDSLAIENVSLMKVDVEGQEMEVLRGGLLTIERWRPVILTEEWETRTTRQISALLGPYGYTRVAGFGGRGKAPVGVWEAK